MSLDESWTFGIFASFDLEVDKVTSKNLTLIQVQTTPDQMQFFNSTFWGEVSGQFYNHISSHWWVKRNSL